MDSLHSGGQCFFCGDDDTVAFAFAVLLCGVLTASGHAVAGTLLLSCACIADMSFNTLAAVMLAGI